MTFLKPPSNWDDSAGWDRYHAEHLEEKPLAGDFERDFRYLGHIKELGGAAWFAGCGTDALPVLASLVGCDVLATDLSKPLIEAGFYIPFRQVESWYRDKLESTGILYAMVLGRPRIPWWDQYDKKDFATRAEADQRILDSFRGEYETRLQAEQPEVERRLNDGSSKVAHLVYSTG